MSMDDILIRCLQLVMRRQREYKGHTFGLVGAAVVAPGFPVIYDTTMETLSGKWRHAERSAIDKFITKFGDLPEETVIVTTLSPCFRDMSDRFGESCSDYLNECGVKKVYTGLEDYTHLEKDPGYYDNTLFEIEVTKNKEIQEMCQRLLDRIEKTQQISD